MNDKTITTKENLMEVIEILETLKIQFWVEGGWGIDILIGKQNRPHRDIDIDFDAKYESLLLDKLTQIGYEIKTDERPVRMELYHPRLGFIDIHPIEVNEDGSARQEAPGEGYFEFDQSFFTKALFEGKWIPCISLMGQKLFHSGYELREVDKMDLDNLKNHFES